MTQEHFTILLLEDVRSPKSVFQNQMQEVSAWPNGLFHTECHVTISWCRKWDDAFEVVQASGPFDLWQLDYDLGRGDAETGLTFLEQQLTRGDLKLLPKWCRSHSGTSSNARRIEDTWRGHKGF